MTMTRILPVAFAVLALAACGGTAAGHANDSHTARHTASAAAPATSVRTYPDHAADTALCNTYNADIQTGDTYDIGQALEQAEGTVSPKLARDIQALVVDSSSASLQTDLKNQVEVTFDCALVKNGISPGN
jgi:PBP1b-binding outer membrane lipoprotein LpoB